MLRLKITEIKGVHPYIAWIADLMERRAEFRGNYVDTNMFSADEQKLV